MTGFLQDLRFTSRMLWKHKAFTAVAVAALALGIGGTTVMYSAGDGVLMRPLPYPDADRLVRLWELWGNGGSGSVSWQNLQDWRAQSRTLERLSGIAMGDYTLVKDGQAERIPGARVTGDFFALLGARPALGRTFSADGFVRGDELILSHEVWKRRFAGAADVLGQSLRLSDRSYIVVGVMPDGFRLPNSAGAVYLPYVADAQTSRGNHFLQVIGRYARGVTPSQAKAELDTIAAALAKSYPDTGFDPEGVVTLPDVAAGVEAAAAVLRARPFAHPGHARGALRGSGRLFASVAEQHQRRLLHRGQDARRSQPLHRVHDRVGRLLRDHEDAHRARPRHHRRRPTR
jgi:putative ABC transport system permease protein